MKYKVCKGCCEIFTDFNGSDYCEVCNIEIKLKKGDGWLELNQEGVGKAVNPSKKGGKK